MEATLLPGADITNSARAALSARVAPVYSGHGLSASWVSGYSLGVGGSNFRLTHVVLGGARAQVAASPEYESVMLAKVAAITRDQADDARWEALLADPRTPALLDRLAAEALEEYDAGLTRDVDELL